MQQFLKKPTRASWAWIILSELLRLDGRPVPVTEIMKAAGMVKGITLPKNVSVRF